MKKINLQHLNALLAAIEHSTLDDLGQLIRAGLGARPLDTINHVQADAQDFFPPLFVAVNTADTNKVALLLDNGADIAIRGPSQRTALQQAYTNRDVAMADFLLARGADPLAVTPLGTRVFDMALACGDVAVMERFIAMGLTLQYENKNKFSTLHFACKSSNSALIQRVLDLTSFRLDHTNQEGRRPIDFAEHLDIFQYCLQQQPDLEINHLFTSGNYSIHRFARDGRTDIVSWLLDKGIDIQLLGNDKNTLLHQAVASKNVALARMLIGRGAKLEARNKGNFRPIHAAAHIGDLEMTKLLVESGAQLNVKGNTHFIIQDTATPLYSAIQKHHAVVARYLIESGANPDEICDSSHATALTAACLSDQMELVELLLQHGASPNGVNKKGSHGIDYFYFPLAMASSAHVVDLLVAAGADVNAKNRDQQTALHMLVDDGRQKLDAIKALVRHGADVDIVDSHGRTPQSWASDQKVTQVLMEGRLNQRESATLSMPQQARQDNQTSYWDLVKDFANLLSGRSDGTAKPSQSATSRLGKELWDCAHHASETDALKSLSEMLKHATKEDVRYLSRGPYDDEAETILHRVIGNARKYDKSDDSLAPLESFNAAIRRLVDLGADVNAVENLYGETPLHKAARVSLSEYASDADRKQLQLMFEVLLDAGADIQAKNENGSTVLDFIKHIDLLDFMLQRGAQFGAVNESLFYTLGYGSVYQTLALLGHGVSLEVKSAAGDTPLLAAARGGRPDLVEFLLAQGADKNAVDAQGKTLLHLCCEGGLSQTVRYIVEHLQPDLNARDATDCTALPYLLFYEKVDTDKAVVSQARAESEATAVFLVQCGARIDGQDADGRTPLSYARTKKLREILTKTAQNGTVNLTDSSLSHDVQIETRSEH